MTVIVAYEGSRRYSSPVNWGVAALLDGDRVVNAMTRQKMPAIEIDELVEKGHLARLVKPIVLPNGVDSHSPFIILELVRNDIATAFLAPDSWWEGSLAAYAFTKEYAAYAFPSLGVFNAYCKGAIDKLVTALRDDSRSEAEKMHLVRAGLVVQHDHPALNAMRASRLRP